MDNEASDSPKLFCAFGKPSIVARVVDPGKFLLGAVLAPSDWFSFRVDKNPV